MTSAQRRSPLHDRAPLANEGGTVRLEERRFLGKLILRGRAGPMDEAVAGLAGAGLPKASPNTAASDAATLLWLSPDEWMVVTEPGAEATLAAGLEEALAGVHHQIADVTDYYTVLRLAGTASCEILMKLTTLDMHERAFKPGEVRGTMLMHCQAVLYMRPETGDGPSFDIFVRWSMADYLWCLIAECGVEFGLPAQKPVTGERLVI